MDLVWIYKVIFEDGWKGLCRKEKDDRLWIWFGRFVEFVRHFQVNILELVGPSPDNEENFDRKC